MLDKNDIALLKDMFTEFEIRLDEKIDQRFIESEAKFDQRFIESEAKFNQRFTESEARTETKIDEKLTRSEAFLLDEMDRLQKNMYKKFDTLEERVNELKQYYRITKFENDTISILIQKIENLQIAVDNLQERVYP